MSLKILHAMCASCGEPLYEGKTKVPYGYEYPYKDTEYPFILLCCGTGCDDSDMKPIRNCEGDIYKTHWNGPWGCYVPNEVDIVYVSPKKGYDKNNMIIRNCESEYKTPSKQQWLAHYCELRDGKYIYVGTGETYPYEKKNVPLHAITEEEWNNTLRPVQAVSWWDEGFNLDECGPDVFIFM